MKFTPKRAVITGASSGIGKAIAELLAQQGASLVLAARRVDELNRLAETLKAKHQVNIEVIGIDLSETGSAEKLFNFSTRDGKSVDFLINNAGIGPYRSFLKTSVGDHKKVIQLNLVTLTETCHLFANHMLEKNLPSSILNVASVASYQPIPRFAVYCATKSYVRFFSEILRYELKDSCVQVSCLCPGGTKTEFLDKNNQSLRMGDFILMPTEAVAKAGIKGAMKNQSIIVPGIFNKLTVLLLSLVPNSLNLIMSKMAMDLAVKETEV